MALAQRVCVCVCYDSRRGSELETLMTEERRHKEKELPLRSFFLSLPLFPFFEFLVTPAAAAAAVFLCVSLFVCVLALRAAAGCLISPVV